MADVQYRVTLKIKKKDKVHDKSCCNSLLKSIVAFKKKYVCRKILVYYPKSL